MDTKDLRYFSCVYETKSINKAAKQLFITPQGLSKTIRKMEEELRTNKVKGIPFEEMMTWDVYGIIAEENKEFDTIQLFRRYLYRYFTKK